MEEEDGDVEEEGAAAAPPVAEGEDAADPPRGGGYVAGVDYVLDKGDPPWRTGGHAHLSRRVL